MWFNLAERLVDSTGGTGKVQCFRPVKQLFTSVTFAAVITGGMGLKRVGSKVEQQLKRLCFSGIAKK